MRWCLVIGTSSGRDMSTQSIPWVVTDRVVLIGQFNNGWMVNVVSDAGGLTGWEPLPFNNLAAPSSAMSQKPGKRE